MQAVDGVVLDLEPEFHRVPAVNRGQVLANGVTRLMPAISVPKPNGPRGNGASAEGELGELSNVGGNARDPQLLIPALAVRPVGAEIMIGVDGERYMVEDRRGDDVIVVQAYLPAAHALNVDKVQR